MLLKLVHLLNLKPTPGSHLWGSAISSRTLRTALKFSQTEQQSQVFRSVLVWTVGWAVKGGRRVAVGKSLNHSLILEHLHRHFQYVSELGLSGRRRHFELTTALIGGVRVLEPNKTAVDLTSVP
jgi:hypothetical protein